MKPGKIRQSLIVALGTCSTANALAQAPDRTTMPIHHPRSAHSTVLDVPNATPPPRFDVKAPAGAPNVLNVLIDDMGFGPSSAFGGPAQMPTAERLADNGLRHNRFSTTALGSPGRMALLTGGNHYTKNTSPIMGPATAFPAATGQRPDNGAPLPMTLPYNGYSTAHFGKNHETSRWETSPSGPTDRWPTRSGFEKFDGSADGSVERPWRSNTTATSIAATTSSIRNTGSATAYRAPGSSCAVA